MLLFGSETWVVTPWMVKSLLGFHHQAVERMVAMVPKRQLNGTWVYTPIWAALVILGLEEIRLYIARRENTVAQKIATHPIMELCLSVEWRMGIKLLQIWLEQPAINILGIRAEHASSET